MARQGNNRTVQKAPEVTFSIELRPATSEQLEAGKRLFSRLINRVQSNIDTTDKAKARSAPGGTAKLPPA